jgi:putative nucleotidyltransferase with HDIG domain
LLKPLSLKLELAAARGLENAICTGDYALGPAGRAIRERNLVVVDGELPQEEDGGEGIRYKGFRSYAACPLTAKGKTLGVLEIFHRDALPQDGEWTQFFESLGRQAAIAIDGALLFEDVQRTNLELFAAYDSTLEGWSRALDLRDKETEGHSMRVTELSEQIARRLNMGPRDLAHLRRGALLHDIGKLAVPDAILRKPEPLLPEEREMMQMHPFHAYQMLSPISFLKESLDIPYCHHEKWDGTGYPRGLKGEQIPLAARIFAIADVWDALRSDRPYRKPWSRKRCLEHVVELSGTHFDPRVVDAFIAYYNECEGVVDPLPDVLEQH